MSSFPDSEITSSFGPTVQLLLRAGKLTEQQVRYALRAQKKMLTATPLLKLLKDLKYIDDQDVKSILRQSSATIRIGDLLTELGYLSEADLQAACELQRTSTSKEKLGRILVTHNFISEQTFIDVLSIQMGYPFFDVTLNNADRELSRKVPKQLLQQFSFLPVKCVSETSDTTSIPVAFSDPMDFEAIAAAKKYLGDTIQIYLSHPSSLRKVIEYLVDKAEVRIVNTDTSTITGVVNSIILAAIEANASDIHIEPMPDRLLIRFREDGVLQVHKEYPSEIIPPLISRLKILCQADITERRRHQGGRILFEYSDGELDLRASFFITIHGEKVVLRLLNRRQELFELSSIGLTPKILHRFLEEAVYQPSGVLLVTGPTGSGKTSTIYSCIHTLRSPEVSIITAEEPVEYVIDGISQCSINPKIDLTFEETLRHIVRQDPDIIVIGEIRDNYSAEVAVQAALTGHKVLTTFHTEDSIGGLIRLMNMEISPFLISSTVVSVLAQRLLRRVCASCQVDVTPTPIQLQRLSTTLPDLAGATFKKGRGCPACKHTGYKGRVGVYELLVLDEYVRAAILERKSSYEIRQLGVKHSGLITLLEDGLVKAAAGITTLEELLRCLPNLHKPRSVLELRRLSGL